MKSWRSTSSIMVRVIRIVVPAITMPRMNAGRMNMRRLPIGSRTSGTSSSRGDHPHQSDAYRITSVATQKLGAATNRIARLRPA